MEREKRRTSLRWQTGDAAEQLRDQRGQPPDVVLLATLAVAAIADPLEESRGPQVEPVSYTHLDVYKRQCLLNERR